MVETEQQLFYIILCSLVYCVNVVNPFSDIIYVCHKMLGFDKMNNFFKQE